MFKIIDNIEPILHNIGSDINIGGVMFMIIGCFIVAFVIYRIFVGINGDDGKPWPHGKE